jgi:lysosomal Pro-X carboxypeptidase
MQCVYSSGGIFNAVNELVEVILIIDGAHHLDLMPSNPADPPTVKIARDFHKERIRRWIRRFRK